MPEVWSIMVWLRSPSSAESDAVTERVRAAREAGQQPAGHHARVFNLPSLQRVSYGQFPSREDAEEALHELGQRLSRGEAVMVRLESHTFLIPAASIQYVALGQGQAGPAPEL